MGLDIKGLRLVALLGAPWGCASMGSATRPPSSQGLAYGERCGRCHDPPPPRAYSDTQWRGVMARMQVEADLSDTEATEILRWLQDNHGDRQ